MFKPFVGFDHDLEKLANGTRFNRDIIRGYQHPNFNTDPTYFDVGVIEIDRAFDFISMAARPACILPARLYRDVFEGNVIVGR